tara:strand:+ start:168 stop:368 length:201 start_codon:yes stop_codon:yes gene_type:complete
MTENEMSDKKQALINSLQKTYILAEGLKPGPYGLSDTGVILMDAIANVCVLGINFLEDYHWNSDKL